MIIRKSKIVFIFLSIVLIFTACSKAEVQVDTDIETSGKAESSNPGNNTQRKMNSRPDMFGKVKSIIGNEVILEMAEMPEMPDRQQQSKNGQNNSGQKSNGGNGGMRPEGMKPENRQLKLTGETATLLIPVGIPITTRSQVDTKEIDIADIYEGVMLQIWFDKSDKENKTITKVSMIQGR